MHRSTDLFLKRLFASLAGLLLLISAQVAPADPLEELDASIKADAVRAARVWPSPENSRITIELDAAVKYKYFSLKNPARIAIDLEGIEPSPALTDMINKVMPHDVCIANIRVARNRPGVTRVVVELKGEVRSQVFTLKPMGDYGHRLVMDLYPVALASIEKQVESAIESAGNSPARQAEQQVAGKAEKSTLAGKPGPLDFVRLITIAIDAGHGGEDPGAKGANGSYEKDITLSIARRLKGLIEKQDNMRAYLTRDGDYFISLHERVNKARGAQADLFVSVHADAFIKPHARGSSVFALSEKGATSAAAKWLAKNENEADLIGGVNVATKDKYVNKALIDLAQTAQIRDSMMVGKVVLEEIGGINQLHKPHVEQAGFAVLKAPEIPSILIETAFISNPEEEKRLNDEEYQDKMANAIVTGIKRYFDRNPPLARSKVAQNL